MAKKELKYFIGVSVKITIDRDESGKLRATSSEPPSIAHLTERLNDPVAMLFNEDGSLANKDEIQ